MHARCSKGRDREAGVGWLAYCRTDSRTPHAPLYRRLEVHRLVVRYSSRNVKPDLGHVDGRGEGRLREMVGWELGVRADASALMYDICLTGGLCGHDALCHVLRCCVYSDARAQRAQRAMPAVLSHMRRSSRRCLTERRSPQPYIQLYMDASAAPLHHSVCNHTRSHCFTRLMTVTLTAACISTPSTQHSPPLDSATHHKV